MVQLLSSWGSWSEGRKEGAEKAPSTFTLWICRVHVKMLHNMMCCINPSSAYWCNATICVARPCKTANHGWVWAKSPWTWLVHYTWVLRIKKVKTKQLLKLDKTPYTILGSYTQPWCCTLFMLSQFCHLVLFLWVSANDGWVEVQLYCRQN